MASRKPPIYLISILLFMVTLPILSIGWQAYRSSGTLSWGLTEKWFLFWAAGVRLFIAGIRQVTKPSFTAQEIFHISDSGSFAIVRELGFANISIGLISMLSLCYPLWRTPAAVAAGLYFALAGMLHIFKRPDSRNEVIAMISDFFIAVLLALCIGMTWG
jgi:hypothetical protein